MQTQGKNFSEELDIQLKTAMMDSQSLSVQYMISSVRQRKYIPSLTQYCNQFQLRDYEAEDGYNAAVLDVRRILTTLGLEVNKKKVEVKTGFSPGQMNETSYATSVEIQ